ncbi:unnamed protein product, partial [Heterotrigona itama]
DDNVILYKREKKNAIEFEVLSIHFTIDTAFQLNSTIHQ